MMLTSLMSVKKIIIFAFSGLCINCAFQYYSKEIQNAQIQMLNPIYTFWSLLYFFFASGEEKGRIHLRNI